ncbi:hypothetical protein [Fluviicola sp.]|uniref:hypothetical protein n=1 Tax=Fluviicola sp. TaxID=1917219 RepID=UPI0031DBF8C4
MITSEQDDALRVVGNAALKNPLWIDYANYCFERKKGLRKEAFQRLDSFLKSAEGWGTAEKIAFLEFLFPFVETIPDADYGPLPHLLSEKLVKPGLLTWCETENSDNRPFRWYGKYYKDESYLLKALELDPADDLVREAIISEWMNTIYHSVHHLPEGYIGEPEKDLELAAEIRKHINLLSSEEQRKYWTNELEEDLELVVNYMEWKQSGHANLAQWGAENAKRVSYGTTRIYYYGK